MRLPLSIVALLCLASAASATVGTVAGGILDYPTSARAAAMGEAYTAADDDVFGVHYNPAVDLKSRQASMQYESGLASDQLQMIGVGAPVGFGRLAATLVSYDAGSITLNNTSNQSTTVNAQKDYLGTLSAAASPLPRLQIGGNFKVLSSELIQQVSATAYLWDFGVIAKPTSRLSVGAAVQNLGSGLKYGSTEESVPQVVRGGFAYKDHYYVHHFEFAFDEVVESGDSVPQEHFGFEYRYGALFAARAGYKIGDDAQGLSAGVGLMIDNLTFDFAYVPSPQWGDSQNVSMTLRF